MTDPYVVLGIPRTASDDEVKTAYRNLAKKYHPDNYANAPDIADVAADKMREVNEAYDTIVKERKNGGSGSGGSYNASSGSYGSSAGSSSYSSNAGSSYSNNSGSSNTGYQAPNYGAQQSGNNTYQNTYSTTTSFADVRRLIMDKRFDDANAVLDGVAADRRNAEWNFLKGTVLYHRGWLEQAYVYLNTAVNMEPGNSEFRAAFNQASQMRNGSSGGYKIGKNKGGCGNPCNMCCSLLCADQCCECCGGDLISCC